MGVPENRGNGKPGNQGTDRGIGGPGNRGITEPGNRYTGKQENWETLHFATLLTHFKILFYKFCSFRCTMCH